MTSPVRRAYVDIPGGQVHYRTSGSGFPLVLLHQNPISSAEYAGMIPMLGRRYRVIAMDTTGYGMSGPPPSNPAIADYARHVREFLQALGIERAHFAAHHTGATIAAEVAAGQPDLVSKMVLSGLPYFDPETRRVSLERLRASSPVRFDPDGAYIAEYWRRLRHYNPQITPGHCHDLLVQALLAGPRREDAHLAILMYEEQERLPLIKSPVLLVSGSQDTFIDRLEVTSRLIPHCTTKVIPGGSSDVCLAMPQEFSRLVEEFLEG